MNMALNHSVSVACTCTTYKEFECLLLTTKALVALVSLCTGQHRWGGDKPRMCGGPATKRLLWATSKGKNLTGLISTISTCTNRACQYINMYNSNSIVPNPVSTPAYLITSENWFGWTYRLFLPCSSEEINYTYSCSKQISIWRNSLSHWEKVN